MDNEEKIKIAVGVLAEISGQTKKEFLEEAAMVALTEKAYKSLSIIAYMLAEEEKKES